MKERPVIFNAEMVRAILDGRKTQTRRVIKLSHERGMVNPVIRGRNGEISSISCRLAPTLCTFGQVGDRLWVRETFAALEPGSHEQAKPQQGYCQELRYAATDRLAKSDSDIRGYKWVPSIHMPRWASRILLEITAVRVERLNDISEADARAEGATLSQHIITPPEALYRVGFSKLWRSIYGEESWGANPWVWVIEFKRVGGSDASK